MKKTKILRTEYLFDDKDSTTLLRFFTSFKQAWDSNGFSEELALCMILKFITDGLAFSLEMKMNPSRVGFCTYHVHNTGEKPIKVLVNAVNFFPKPYESDSNIAKAIKGIAYLTNELKETSLLFAVY